jgi:hypothetical protein
MNSQSAKKKELLDFRLKEQRRTLAPPQYRQALKYVDKSRQINYLFGAIMQNIDLYYSLKNMRNVYAKSVLFSMYEFKILHFLVGVEKLNEDSLKYYKLLLTFGVNNASFIS